MYCNVLQCIAVYCSVLQCITLYYSVLHCNTVYYSGTMYYIYFMFTILTIINGCTTITSNP